MFVIFQVEKILEERVSELSATKVNQVEFYNYNYYVYVHFSNVHLQLIAVMIRKHLSWLIVWGNGLGAIVGVVAEVITVLVSKNALET